MSAPTAPFCEAWVGAVLDTLLDAVPGLERATDRFGNRIVRLRRGRTGGPVVAYVAHLDHPGFVFEACDNPAAAGEVAAVFEGGVNDSYFVGAPIRAFRSADDLGVTGRVIEAGSRDATTLNRAVRVELDASVQEPVLAMWDLPGFEVEDGMIRSRACDDLAGVATIVETLARLAADTAPVDVAAVFTRAEECGFLGALALAEDGTYRELLGDDVLFVSVETSGETSQTRAGEGAVIRVGDRTSVFDAVVSNAMARIAKRQGLTARRALMDRGTCEATAIARAGLRTGAVCVPLRNYHNMNTETGQIDVEMVAESDCEALVELMRHLALTPPRGDDGALPEISGYDDLISRARARMIHP